MRTVRRRRHVWGPMTPTKHQGQYFSLCYGCGTRIWGSAQSTPQPADLKFQNILPDCDEQLVHRIMES